MAFYDDNKVLKGTSKGGYNIQVHVNWRYVHSKDKTSGKEVNSVNVRFLYTCATLNIVFRISRTP